MDWRIILFIAALAAIQVQGDAASNGTVPARSSSPPPIPEANVTAAEKSPQTVANTDDVPKNIAPPKQQDHVETLPKQHDTNATVDETDNIHCCGHELRACLSSSGDGSNGILSLEVTAHKDLHVTITPPSFLSAEPSEFSIQKGKPVIVQVEIINPEEAKHYQGSAKILLKSDDGLTCEVTVPSFTHNNLLHGFNSSIRTPVVVFGMLGASAVIVVGIWIYCQCNKDSRKDMFQELEMTDNHDPQALPTSRGGDHIVVNINGSSNQVEENGNWDEVWDDDWEDRPLVPSSKLPRMPGKTD